MPKLAKVEINNIKNVEHGVIDLSSSNGYKNVLGIYGQNGSGKTTLIDVSELFQTFAFKESVPEYFSDFLDGTGNFSLVFDIDGELYEYHADLFNEDMKTTLVGEYISKLRTVNSKKPKKIFGYSTNEAGQLNITSSLGSFNSMASLIEAVTSDGSSFIFGQVFSSQLKAKSNFKSYNELTNVIEKMRSVAFHLNIYTTTINAELGRGVMMPISFSMTDGNGRHVGGTLPVGQLPFNSLSQQKYRWTADQIALLEEQITRIDRVLYKIIPGMHISSNTYKEMSDDGESTVYRIELYSMRGNHRIPMHAESFGIKKLISVLSLLIEMYSNEEEIVLIDELDAGIFEYLLGEIVSVLQEGGQGQLIFTSHNLVVLEQLPSQNIIFTSAKPTHRYTQFTGVRPGNNLRKQYLREMTVFEKDEPLAIETSKASIANAFETERISAVSDDGFDFGFSN